MIMNGHKFVLTIGGNMTKHEIEIKLAEINGKIEELEYEALCKLGDARREAIIQQIHSLRIRGYNLELDLMELYGDRGNAYNC